MAHDGDDDNGGGGGGSVSEWVSVWVCECVYVCV